MPCALHGYSSQSLLYCAYDVPLQAAENVLLARDNILLRSWVACVQVRSGNPSMECASGACSIVCKGASYTDLYEYNKTDQMMDIACECIGVNILTCHYLYKTFNFITVHSHFCLQSQKQNFLPVTNLYLEQPSLFYLGVFHVNFSMHASSQNMAL